MIMVDFSEPCLTLRDLLCRRYGVRNPSLCGLRYEGTWFVLNVDIMKKKWQRLQINTSTSYTEC